MNSASNEYSSLIAGSKAGSGTYTYNKFISTVTTNDLISAPFNGQTFADFYNTISPYAIYQNPTGGQTKVLFGRFNNDTGLYQNNDPSGTATMDAGEGFRAGSGIYKENFSSDSFYNSNLSSPNNYRLNNHPKWGAANFWYIDNTNGTTHVSEDYKKSTLKHGFSGLSQGDKVTARIELSIEGSDDISSGNFSIAKFGFTTVNGTTWGNANSNFIFLSKINNNLVIRNNSGGNFDTDPTNYDQFQTSTHLNNNYILEVSLTIGSDASSSTMSANLINADNLSQETGEGSYSGLADNSGTDTGLYSAVTGSDGIYFLMTSSVLSKITSGKLILKGLSLYVNDNTLPFTGTFETSNVTEPISLGTDATYGRWNLIGNPFPSYLDLNDFFTNNTGNLESGTTNGCNMPMMVMIVYDGSVWTIYNGNNSSGQYIAPGQAFFVASDSQTDVDVNFNTGKVLVQMTFSLGKEDLMMIHLLKTPLALTLRSLLLLVLMTLNTQLLIFI